MVSVATFCKYDRLARLDWVLYEETHRVLSGSIYDCGRDLDEFFAKRVIAGCVVLFLQTGCNEARLGVAFILQM